MRAIGLEPTRGCPHQNLNLVRLPIPPRPQRGRIIPQLSDGAIRHPASFCHLVRVAPHDCSGKASRPWEHHCRGTAPFRGDRRWRTFHAR